MDVVEVVIALEQAPTTDQIEQLVVALAPNLPGQTTFAPKGDNHPDVQWDRSSVTVTLAAETFTMDDAAPDARGRIYVEDAGRNVVARALFDLNYNADEARIILSNAKTGG